MKYKWTWVAVGMFLFLSLWNEVVFSNDNVTNQYGYDWTFEPHEDGSIHVKVKITLGEPTSSYSFPSSFPVDLLSGIGAFTEETGEEIEVIGPEEELPMYRFEFGDDTEKPKGFNFIVEFDLMNWVEEIDVEIYSFSWEWIVDHKTSHTASIVLGEHELLSVEPPPDQDQFIAFNKAVPKLTPFEFEVTFSKKGKELIEEGEEDFEQGEANNDRLLLEKARSEYLEAITFYSKLRTIYGRDKDEFLNELEARVKKINQLLEEPETPFYHDWTFTVSEDDRSVHVAAKITLGSPRLSYSFMVPDNFSAINIQAEGVEVTEIKEDDKKRYVCEFETEEEEGFTFEVEFDLENYIGVKDEVYSFSWKYTIFHSSSHIGKIIFPEKHELLSVRFLIIEITPLDQFITFNKAVPKLTPFEFEVTFSKKGKELIEEGEEDFEQGEANNDRLLLEKARSEYLEAITFYSKLRTIYGRDKDEFLNELEARVKKINQLLEEPETPFYHDWTFTVSEDDRSVHVAAKITLGSPRLSYSFMVPDNFSAINIQAEGVEVTEIKEDDKKRYVCEFETEEEKEFTFEVEFDLENWVKVKHVRDEVYSFSWKYTIYHSASHTVEIILYEKHEILSGGPDQDQVYVPFTKEAPELTPFEFEVTFSKKGKELIEEGENLFEQGKQTGSMKTCVEARDKYTEAINFYSKYLAPMINDQNINIFLGSLRAEKENINIFLKEWDEAENSLNDARSFLTKGSFKEAIEYAERAGVIYEKLGYKKEKADCMLVTARAYLEGKNFEKALEYVGLAKTVYEGIDYEPGIENSEELIREIEAAWMWWRIIIIIETILIVSALSIGIYQRKSIKPIFSRTMGEIYHLIKFRKILNPYIAGPPIKSEKMFFGREDVFTFIKKKFSAEKKNIAIFLYAERKTGKTSVLYQIENRRLGKEFIPVHIDIQEMAGVKSEKEFLQKVTTKIVESLEKFRVIHHGSREYSEINALIKEYDTKQNPYSVFDEVLDRASQVSKKKYLILMFDEYDLLRKKVESEGMSLDIVQYIRHLIQKRERLAFIFTGSEYRLKTGAKEWDLMLGCAIPKKIDFLTRDDALDLMKIPVGYKIDYKEEAVNKIIRLTGCHPFFLQLFLQNLVYHLNKTKKYGVEVADINQVLKYSLENASPHLSFIWKDSEPGERIVLSALAELIKSEDQYVSVEEVIDELQARKEKLQEIREIREERIIKKAFSRLVDKKILERKGEAMYNFKADFLRYWVENEHPLFRTLEDIEENIRGGEKNEPIY